MFSAISMLFQDTTGLNMMLCFLKDFSILLQKKFSNTT